MSEIEKMYLLAGIRKGRMSDEDCAEDCLDYECKNCRYSNYPQFTAEKQIRLIKWLSKRPLPLLIGYYKGKYYLGNSYFNSKADSFDNAIATRINDIWQSLTEEEKQQIKEILE